MADTYHEIPGGKGANQAVAAARLTPHVSLIGRVGEDRWGRQLVDDLRREGVDVQGIGIVPDRSTGMAVVYIEPSGENMIVVVPGANGSWDSWDPTEFQTVLQTSDLLLLQLEVPFAVIVAAVQAARSVGVPVILDPAPAVSPFPEELWQVDVLCPNASEAQILLGTDVHDRSSALVAVRALQSRGPRHAFITLGAGGVVYSFDGQAEWFPPYSVTSIDSTGAGDAFAAALGVRWCELGLRDERLEEAIPFASAAGAWATTRVGAQPAMPRRTEIEQLMART